MKKAKLLISVFSLLASSVCWAEPIDVEQARMNAAQFMGSGARRARGKYLQTKSSLRLRQTRINSEDQQPLYYVFNVEDQNGFILASGDDATKPILAYSDEGVFNPDSLPCCAQYLLDSYAEQISYARKNPTMVQRSRAMDIQPSIAPMVHCTWNQGEPYNNLCPIPSGESDHCPTGCVATAIGQIMYYYKWPEKGTGSYSYNWNGQTLSANFGQTTYDWGAMMRGEIDAPNSVSTLLYHIGVAVDMNYGIDGSAAYSQKVSQLATFFGYENQIKSLGRNSVGLKEWETTIYQELAEGRPVLYSGNPECGDGHAFVCDGYENGYFHLNLGWGGYANGYYELDAINTSSTYELNQNQWIEYGIQPPSGKTAVETCVINDVKYALDKINSSVIVCKSNMTGDVSIPASVNIGGKEYPVSAIESYAFKGCNELASLVIPENISYIGAGAFEGCEKLERVTINSNAIASFCKDGIYDYATNIFKDTPLRCVTFGDAVTSIGDYLFDECSTLEEVDLGANTKTIGRLAFANCTELSSIHFHQNLEEIGELAFSGCLVTALNLPDNLKRIEAGAFNLCSGLSSIIIGESLEEMSQYAFTNCSSLTSITINSNAIASKDLSSSSKSLFPSAPIKNVSFGDAVTAIGPYLFYNCSTLEEIHFGENIETINDGAFCNCKSLSSVSFLPKLEYIGIAAFAGCTSLTTVTIPENVMTISDGAFSSCSNLTSVIINTNADIFYPSRFENTPVKSVTFGDAVTSICNGAFQNILDKIAIEEIKLGENIESIGRFAFAGSKIKSIFIPSKVKDIAESAFSQCNELSSIVFAEGLKTIDRYTFAHCKNLKSVHLPNSLTTIGSSAFEDCSSLASVTIPENATSIDFSAFKDCPSLESVTINCPTVKGWFREMTSIKEVQLGEKVSEIGWFAFYGCSGLTMITIPAGVTSIDSNAFKECSNLTTVTLNCNVLVSKKNPCLGNQFGQQVTEYILGNTVTRIGEYAFSYCENLNSVTIPQSVTSIGMHAFRDCSSLTSITIPHSVTSIETSAFMNCSSLASVSLSEGLTVISKELFEGCSNLNNIIIPEGVTTIEDLAFLDCSSLTSITIPESVNTIGYGAFSGCI